MNQTAQGRPLSAWQRCNAIQSKSFGAGSGGYAVSSNRIDDGTAILSGAFPGGPPTARVRFVRGSLAGYSFFCAFSIRIFRLALLIWSGF
jgi:hypothetical protein